MWYVFQNMVEASSVILKGEYLKEWERVEDLTGTGPTDLINLFESFLQLLVTSQADTYTSPFEIVSHNIGKKISLFAFQYGLRAMVCDLANLSLFWVFFSCWIRRCVSE